MMKTKIVLIIAIVLCLSFRVTYAQGCHSGGNMSGKSACCKKGNSSDNNKYAQYGGTVNWTGKYYIEMVYQPMMMQDPLMFFLMNKKGKPLSCQGITGNLEMTFQDGSIENIALQPKGENRFVVQMTDKTKPVMLCGLTLQIKGKTIKTGFTGSSFKGNNISATNNYACPMHPEITGKAGDKCSKCGMDLEKTTK